MNPRASSATLALCILVLATPTPAAKPKPRAPRPVGAYPFYMPMQGLQPPAVRLLVKCDTSRAAGHEVYEGPGAATLYGRVQGGFEFVYEALDSRRRPCVYPFAPWQPQIVGALQGTQYVFRSSIPGKRVTFHSDSPWATIDLRLFQIGRARVHFEMKDISLDFPRAVQPMGALHLEATGATKPGLFTAVIRRSKLYGGKNALFVPSGQTMLYVEDSEIAGNVGTNVDQEHGTYINGILVSHLKNSSWHGQLGWQDKASGHQLKDKAYLRIYENVTVSNATAGTPPSAMPLVDASAFGFTWAKGLKLKRLQPLQSPRDSLFELRTEIRYGEPGLYPWPVLATPGWHMPAQPLTALDQLYLAVFQDTSVESFRNEPFVFRLFPTGTSIIPGTQNVAGNADTTPDQQRFAALSFGARGRAAKPFAATGWTFTNPTLPPQSRWVLDRDTFIRHALSLVGR
ncbi:MAG: hypothetical protein KGN34_01545 [Sphingomonadales bacterium]|nr:hypothetical protein [Sphingomonadales bacterium]